MVDSKVAAGWLFGVAAAAAAGFAAVSYRALRGKTSRLDRIAQTAVHEHRSEAARSAAKLSGPLGKWYTHLPAALSVGFRLERAGRRRGAIAVVASSIGAALLSRTLDRVLKHRLPPPERGEPWEQSYPSGHALETALAVTSGYVLIRERLATPWVGGPLSLASLASGLGRLLLDRHWTSDLVGGYCAGISYGAACAGVYELSRAN